MKSLLAHLFKNFLPSTKCIILMIKTNKSASIFSTLNKLFLTLDDNVSGYFYCCLTM